MSPLATNETNGQVGAMCRCTPFEPQQAPSLPQPFSASAENLACRHRARNSLRCSQEQAHVLSASVKLTHRTKEYPSSHYSTSGELPGRSSFWRDPLCHGSTWQGTSGIPSCPMTSSARFRSVRVSSSLGIRCGCTARHSLRLTLGVSRCHLAQGRLSNSLCLSPLQSSPSGPQPHLPLIPA